MAETELKIIMDAAAAEAVWPRAIEAGFASSAPDDRLLRSIYHDTADHALSAAKIALRLRDDGVGWVQTVKAKGGMAGGLSRTEEWEARAPEGRIDLDLIDDEALRARIAAIIGDNPISPVCETAIRRRAGVVTAPCDGRAELAVDVGEIIAGKASAPFCELEIELLEGPLASLYEIAGALLPTGGWRFSHMSKAQRGYLLAAEGRITRPPAPRNARTPQIAARQTAEMAAREALRECLDQIAANIDVVRAIDDPEGPHQLRIGLRRLRSAFSVFFSAIDGPALARLEDEARWLGHEVGALRDLDVALADIVAPAAAQHPEEPGFQTLAAALKARTQAVRADLRATLGGARVQTFILDLARFVETRGWLDPDDITQTPRLAIPAPKLARAALGRAWKATEKRAEGIRDLSIQDRHDLRKALKRLRYATEFLAPLYSRRKYRIFLKHLKHLQTVFGDLNDMAMAEALFTGPGAVGAEDPAAQRAVGRILGASTANAERSWAEAAAMWRALENTPRFWK